MVKMKQHIYQAPDPKVRVAYTVLKAYAIAQRCPPSQRAVAYVLAHENAQPKPVGAISPNSELEEKNGLQGLH